MLWLEPDRGDVRVGVAEVAGAARVGLGATTVRGPPWVAVDSRAHTGGQRRGTTRSVRRHMSAKQRLPRLHLPRAHTDRIASGGGLVLLVLREQQPVLEVEAVVGPGGGSGREARNWQQRCAAALGP